VAGFGGSCCDEFRCRQYTSTFLWQLLVSIMALTSRVACTCPIWVARPHLINCMGRWACAVYSIVIWLVGSAFLVSGTAWLVQVCSINFCWYNAMEQELSLLIWSTVWTIWNLLVVCKLCSWSCANMIVLTLTLTSHLYSCMKLCTRQI